MENLKYKEDSIFLIYKLIIGMVGESYFEVVDYWEADNFALGLKREDKLIYISTWKNRFKDKSNIKYFLSIEIIDENNLSKLGVSEDFEDISKDELLRLILTKVVQNEK